jgi:hypothetical protein
MERCSTGTNVPVCVRWRVVHRVWPSSIVPGQAARGHTGIHILLDACKYFAAIRHNVKNVERQLNGAVSSRSSSILRRLLTRLGTRARRLHPQSRSFRPHGRQNNKKMAIETHFVPRRSSITAASSKRARIIRPLAQDFECDAPATDGNPRFNARAAVLNREIAQSFCLASTTIEVSQGFAAREKTIFDESAHLRPLRQSHFE